jgi:hypothetical protein
MSEYDDADLSEPCDNCGLPVIDCECQESDFDKISGDEFDAQEQAYK